jgi:hypothetical protein
MQMLDGPGCGFFDWIGDNENASGASIDGNEYRSVALFLKLRGFRFELLQPVYVLRFQ